MVRRFGPSLCVLLFTATVYADCGPVTAVYDGDTLAVAASGRVRLLGIDVPETDASPRDAVYRRQGVSAGGLRRSATAAKAYVRRVALGNQVCLEKEGGRDPYGRLLAYVILADGRNLNRELLDAGYAAVYRRFDFSRKEEFLAAEARARQKGRGMWQNREEEKSRRH